MLNFPAAGVPAAQVPFGFWIWAIVALAIAVVAGFVAGQLVASSGNSSAKTLKDTSLEDLLAMIKQRANDMQSGLNSLEEQYAGELEELAIQELADQQARLQQKLKSLREKRATLLARKQSVPLRQPQEFEISWQQQGAYDSTGLPDRQTFNQNLQALMAAVTTNHRDSGLLLIKLERFEHLTTRFGESAAVLVRKLGSVVIRNARDADLVCRFSGDTLGVLLPAIDSQDICQLAAEIHKAIRDYCFRIDEDGPEVLVTASVGGTVCSPEESADIVLNRTGDALAHAVNKGRNQLHMLTGRERSQSRSA